MEHNNAFPPVLKNLINSINAEGRLRSWQLQTTLETYSLTLEWIRPASCKGIDDHKFKPIKSDLRTENLHSAQAFGQTVTLLETDRDYEMETNAQGKNGKTKNEFPESFVQNPGTDNIIEEDTELNALSESATPEAIMNENEVKYKTQVSSQEKRQRETSTKIQVCGPRFYRKTQFCLTPGNHRAPIANVSGQVANGNSVTETHSVPYSKQDEHEKKAICSCGETFTSRNSSISHLLSTCPVSICFRIELECNMQRVIDSWHGDQKVIGKAWWQSYQRNGFPDSIQELKDEKAEQLKAMVNQFIERALAQTLIDHNGNEFVLITGLNHLDD